MTPAAIAAHAQRHGHALPAEISDKNAITMPKLSQPVDPMTKTERQFSLILEARKRRGEIIEWRHHGIKLAWGEDPKTGKVMWYTPDFTAVMSAPRQKSYIADFVVIEIKSGASARKTYKDRVRFRGCRACWPMFSFELHQKKEGQWKRIE